MMSALDLSMKWLKMAKLFFPLQLQLSNSQSLMQAEHDSKRSKARVHAETRIAEPFVEAEDSEKSSSLAGQQTGVSILKALKTHLAWMPANWTWHKFKPLIRCSVAAWLAIVLFVIPPAMRAMGGTVRSLPLRSLQWKLIKSFRRTFSFLSVNYYLESAWMSANVDAISLLSRSAQ